MIEAMGISDVSWTVFANDAPSISLVVLIVLSLLVLSFRLVLKKRGGNRETT